MDKHDDSATGGATSSERTGGPSRARVAVIGGAAIALAIGAVATSLAASPTQTTTPGSASAAALFAPAAVTTDPLEVGRGGFERGRFGGRVGFREVTIRSINGSSINLGTDDGWTRTITITDDTTLTKGGQEIEASELAVGDQVRLIQTRSDDGTYTVTRLAVVVPHVSGEVSQLSSTGFKVTTHNGSVWTITTDSETVYRYGAADGTSADVANGDKVLVQGESTGDNALSATSVTVPGDRVGGTVTATTSSSITIETRAGDSVTIHVDGDTTYRIRTDDDPAGTLADIAVGDVIGAAGRERADGSLDAAVVAEGRLGGRHGRFEGRGPWLHEGSDESTDVS
jgi:hypothetical protein